MAHPHASDLVAALGALVASMRPGQRLPSEQQIMATHGVSRATARAALTQLEDLYLVRRVQGTGTFVNRRIDYPISAAHEPSFTRTVTAAGARAHTVFLARATRPAPTAVAERLRVPEGTECVRLERLGHIDDFPACYFQEWFSPRAIPDVDVALRVFDSVAETFRAGGYEPVRQHSVGTVDIAPAAVCEHLGLPPHRQTWYVQSTNADRASRLPLMLSRAWSRLDQVRMVFENEF